MNKTVNNKKDNTKKTKRRAYESLLLLLLTISLFITATFAWFTDSAFSKGNKVFAGNLYVDIIITEEDLKEQLLATNNELSDENVQGYINSNYANYKYARSYKVDGEDVTDTYYRISAMPDSLANGLSSINLYNVEPGQAKKVTVNYMNNGDLAFKAGGALKLEYDNHGDLKSYTGLETLNQQIDTNAKVGTYKNNYSVNEKSGNTQSFNYYMKTMTSNNYGAESNYNVTLDIYFDTKNYETAAMKVIEFKNVSEPGKNDVEKIKAFCEKCIGQNIEYVYSIPNTETTDTYIRAIRNALLGAYNNLRDNPPASTTSIELEVYDTINPKLISQGVDSTEAEYEYYNVSTSNMNKTQYEKRFKKLLAMQGVEINDPSTTTLNHVQKYEFDGDGNPTNTSNHLNYYDNGGHLEDVLEVYVGVPSEVEHTVFETKDPKYYFGNLHEFTFLMENGPTANPDFDYDSYVDDPNALSIINSKFAEKSKTEAEGKTYEDTIYPEEEYMYLYQNVNANLNKDYQNYLTNAGGYCIPKDVISNDGVVPSKEGVKVKIYDKDNNVTEQLASEIGSCDFVIYMPTDADSRYQNASISLQLGVTATQAEFEMDDTGYMVYDKFGSTNSNKVNKNSVLKIKNGDVDELYRVLNIDDNLVTVFRMPNENDYKNIVDQWGMVSSPDATNAPYVIPYYSSENDILTFEGPNLLMKGSSDNTFIKYDGSNLDNICDNFYENYILNDSLKSSIVNQDFTQNAYSFNPFKPEDIKNDNNYYFIGDSINEISKICSEAKITRKVRSLAISDIVNSLGNTFDNKMLLKFLTNIVPSVAEQGELKDGRSGKVGLPMRVWLADSCNFAGMQGVLTVNGGININEIVQDSKMISGLVSFVFTFDNNEFDDFEIVDEWDDMYSEKNVSIILHCDESENPESLKSYINKFYVNSPVNDLYKTNFDYNYIFDNQSNETVDPATKQNNYIDAAVGANKDAIVFELTDYSDIDHLAEVINNNKDILFISFCSERSVALDDLIESPDLSSPKHYYCFSTGDGNPFETELGFISDSFGETIYDPPIISDFIFINGYSTNNMSISGMTENANTSIYWRLTENDVRIMSTTYCNYNHVTSISGTPSTLGNAIITSNSSEHKLVIISNSVDCLNQVAQFCKDNSIIDVKYFNFNGNLNDEYSPDLYANNELYARRMNNENLSEFILDYVMSLYTNTIPIGQMGGINCFIQERLYPSASPTGK